MPADLTAKIKFRDATAKFFAAIENEFTIQPKIALVQAALESNWGLSELAVQGNNIFSITPGDAWTQIKNANGDMNSVANWSSLGKPVILFPTTEYSKLPPNKIHYWEVSGDIRKKSDDGHGGTILTVDRYFRKYADWEESSWDWARKIAKFPRYWKAYEAAKIGDLGAFAQALVNVGYATDPAYAAEILMEGRAVDALPPMTI